MVAAAAGRPGVALGLVAERAGTEVYDSGLETVWHIDAEEQDSGPGMGLVILETFPACPKL